MSVKWSDSRRSTLDRCPRQYKYKYVDKLPRGAPSESMKRGSAADAAGDVLLIATAGNILNEKMLSALAKCKWQDMLNAIEKKLPGYPEDLASKAIGYGIDGARELIRQGWRLAYDLKSGTPLVQLHLVGRIAGVEYHGYADFVCQNKANERAIFDRKISMVNGYSVEYARVAPQVATYLLLGAQNADRIGRIAYTGYLVTKPNKMPKTTLYTVPILEIDSQECADRIAFASVMANYYAEHKFWPRKVNGAYESPCGLCDYRENCLPKSHSGVGKRAMGESPKEKAA